MIGRLSGSRQTYRLTEQREPVEGFEAFFRAGFPATVISVERRHLNARLKAITRARTPTDAREAMLDAVLVDRRGGRAWQRYLTQLVREGRSVPPAPLLPRGTVRITRAGADIIYSPNETAWAFYLGCKAAARLEPGFRAQLVGSSTRSYTWTIAEEVGCLQIFTEAVLRAANQGQVPSRLAAHILAAQEAGVLVGYVLVEGLGTLAPGYMAGAGTADLVAGRAYLRWAARPMSVLPPPQRLPAVSRTPVDTLRPRDQMRLEAALAALSAGATDEARRTLAQLGRQHPRNGQVWAAQAEVHLRLGDPTGAARAAERADQEAPGQPSTWALLARARLAAGDSEGAREAADRVRWLWWLGREPVLMRAPVFFWGRAGGGAVVERLDAALASTPRFWWIDPTGARAGQTSRVLTASDPSAALREARSLGTGAWPSQAGNKGLLQAKLPP